MKAKNTFSHYLEKSTANSAIVVFGAAVVFLGGFIVWSASCVGGACVDVIRQMV
jgi:hypothetical protein